MENYIKIDGVQIELTQEQVEQIKSLGISSKKSPKWEDFGEIKGYFVSADSQIEKFEGYSSVYEKNIFPSKEEADACLALSQLCQWRDKYNEGWKPKWLINSTEKYCVYFSNNELSVTTYITTHTILSFKTREIRDKFLEDFKDLIEIAKPLL